MTKQEQLDSLEREIVDENVCSELAEQAIQIVMGGGNADAEIMFIGEAPGKKEDEQGLPFVGASGKFLDKMLAEAGMSRDDVCITSIVKYRPPENRDPTPEEKNEFWPYLQRQVEIIDPKVIVTLGRHSLEYFLPGAKISEVHGQVVHDKSQKWTIVPLYHPAAALYNGGMRQTLINDFLNIKNSLL